MGQSARFRRDSDPILLAILVRFWSRIVAESRGYSDHPFTDDDSRLDLFARYQRASDQLRPAAATTTSEVREVEEEGRRNVGRPSVAAIPLPYR